MTEKWESFVMRMALRTKSGRADNGVGKLEAMLGAQREGIVREVVTTDKRNDLNP